MLTHVVVHTQEDLMWLSQEVGKEEEKKKKKRQEGGKREMN